MIDFEALAAAMGELDEDTVRELLEQVMAEGGADAAKAMEACQKGMDTVGNLFEEGEYFVGDLIYAGELMTDAVAILKDALVSGSAAGPKTRMILCTVKDDLHDIGKNIVRSMLEANGFEVLDLGIDCPAEKVVETARAEGIKIVALSGVLTLALDSMKTTVDALKAAGLDVKANVPADGIDWGGQECCIIGWGSPYDADDHTYKVFSTDAGANYSGYSNPEVDEWLKKARQTDDPAERAECYKQFQIAMAKAPAYTFFAYIDAMFIADSNIKGIDANTVLGHHGVGIFWNVTEWTIE